MMKEKKKGLLQRGIMVAVSALTIVAGAGTVLAYEPMQSSDASFEDIVFEPDAEEITIRNSDIVTSIDFSKSDNVFILIWMVRNYLLMMIIMLLHMHYVHIAWLKDMSLHIKK